jgi:hypothetical protein
LIGSEDHQIEETLGMGESQYLMRFCPLTHARRSGARDVDAARLTWWLIALHQISAIFKIISIQIEHSLGTVNDESRQEIGH